MRISHKHKFVFIGVPRTGSNSIKNTLNDFSDIKSPPPPVTEKDVASPYYMHNTSFNLKNHFEHKGWNWNEYFKFGYARNPWDLAVSSFFFLKSKTGYENYMFDEFIFGGRHILTNQRLPPNANQIDFFTDNYSGEYIINYIGRFEYIQEDFNEICAEIGISCESLPHMLKTKHNHYREYYNAKTKDFIAKRYKRDISEFGYDF
jgi:hypothetical protein